MPPLSTAAYLAFQLAAHEAASLSHPLIEPEHLLVGICKSADYAEAANPDPQNLTAAEWQGASREFQRFAALYTRLSQDNPSIVTFRRRLRGALKAGIPEQPFTGHRSDRCRTLFRAAEELARTQSAPAVSLVMLFREVLALPEAPLLDQCLKGLQLKRPDWLARLGDQDLLPDGQSGASVADAAITPPTADDDTDQNQKKPEAKVRSKTPTLDQFGRDLTAQARAGRLDPVIGRKNEIRDTARVLLRRGKGNPMLVGDAGVGKTCIVEGLAQRVVAAGAARQIQSFRIIELNLNALVAGTKYRGDFEERLDNVIREAASDPTIILFIDEIHTILSAGATQESSGAANILKPALARGDIRCIGATTTAEYRRYIERDAALERRFQVVWIEEPNRGDAIAILKGLAPRLEAHHQIRIPDAVIEKAVDLSIRYLRDFRLPDKAIDLLDQACASRMLATMTPDQSRLAEPDLANGQSLELSDILAVVSGRTRIPVSQLNYDDQARIQGLESFLLSRIAGQDEAIHAIAETVRMAKVGLRDPGKPLAVFLFLGSTGTGKSETAKCLAEYLFDDPQSLITIDMSEFQEKHTLSKLIGAPPGYVGYDEEGILIAKVRSRPYSVIVFDEIEKAAPEIFDIFLQMFDEGRLTDPHGRTICFSETIIILTSNLGSSLGAISHPRQRIGFPLAADSAAAGTGQAPADAAGAALPLSPSEDSRWADYRRSIQQAVAGALRPEILNRIQKTIIFYPLGRAAQRLIVDRMLQKLNHQLADRAIVLSFSDTAAERIIDQGFNQAFGARETQRTFERLVTEPLARLLSAGQVHSGQSLTVDVQGNDLIIRAVPDLPRAEAERFSTR